MKNKILFACTSGLFCLAMLLSSCSSRTFSINCEPSGSLIMQGTKYSFLTSSNIVGVAPLQTKVMFLGKNDSYFFSATKRGFYPDTVYITRDSALSLTFSLKPIEGADTTTFNPAKLKGASFIMLPVLVDVYLHKGVGSLDKYEYTETQSSEVTKNLDNGIREVHSQSNTEYPGLVSVKEPDSWKFYSEKYRDFLLDLNGNLLNYYPEHPSIKGVYWPIDKLFQVGSDSSRYLVYTYCKTVKPTAGRIVGNIAATVAAGAVEGYNTATYGYSISYYNAEAFSIDNNTLIVSFVICPKTGKVLFRKDTVVGYDIVGEKGQKNITATILGMMKEFENNELSSK